MQNFPGLGKLLIAIGVVLVLLGFAIVFFEKIPFIGKLPGDIFIRKGNFSFYFPLTTGLVISVILTLLLRFIVK